ncbi:MAG TPA: VOC family protein, partial [Solirubrobacterales bacterium]|nr:VOC family protein [Solirubrobacterales bacterium]
MSENGSIDPGTSIGAVGLTVADLDRVRDFYRDAIGLSVIDSNHGGARLGAGDGPLIELTGEPSAPERGRDTTGLFHLAILVPSRADL